MQSGKIMSKNKHSGWWWVPSLYYAEGIPYVVVMSVSVIMYKKLGISNTEIALYTSWLYIPWIIKPFWSPVVELLRTKRFWIVTMQLIIGAGLGGVALTIPVPNFFRYTLLCFWLLAFSSATHDIAVDGFYMLGLSGHEQAWFVGIRSTFYRLAMITGQGLLVILAGFVENSSGLASVKISVNADPTYTIQNIIPADSLPVLSDPESDLKIMIYPEELHITTIPQSHQKLDSIITTVKSWNESTGHVLSDRNEEALKFAKPQDSSIKRQILVPIENFIRKNFGENRYRTGMDQTGNIGIIYIYLSKAPKDDDDIIINFGRNSGDKSIFLLQYPFTGNRLIFNQKNWNLPGLAIIQLDPKLKYASQTEFIAQSGNISLSWVVTFIFLAVLFLLFFAYHRMILPYPATDHPAFIKEAKKYIREFINTFLLFFKKENISSILGFLLLFRLAESQIVKLASPFLLDPQELGGLALTTGEVGLVYGTVGIIALSIGGLLGGFLAARHGLKYWIWPMVIAINLPDLVYVYLSTALPDSFLIINLSVAIEQFGYGFGFTAYMLVMIYVSQGNYKTAHFAITTGFMALGMMIPGMVSGYIQELLGYRHFFIWVMIATIPSFLCVKFIHLDPDFGKRKEKQVNS